MILTIWNVFEQDVIKNRLKFDGTYISETDRFHRIFFSTCLGYSKQ